ncbi:hypothetical protein AS593_09840 [Caulobacter vibrioides]|nr:hypothetical protein AS593_09840 [Caulobacter vibrioides]
MSVSLLAAVMLALSVPQGAAPPAVEEVEVSPRGVDPYPAFVRRATPLTPAGKVMSWAGPLCPFVAGGRTEENRYLHDRISQMARDAGVKMAGKGCRPNLTVVLADEPEALVRKARTAGKFWVDRERPLSFERYATTDRPVRVWTNYAEVGVMRGSTAAGGLGNDLLMYATDGAGSRVRTSVVGVIQDQFVVVDRRRMGGRKLAGLADYVAMAGVASARADQDYAGFNTVLNLFTEDGRADASPMDKAYLRGLRAVKPEAPGGVQLGQVVTAMRAERDGR